MVVGVDVDYVGRTRSVVAVRTVGERCLDDPVQMFGEGAGDAEAATTGRLLALGLVGFLPL